MKLKNCSDMISTKLSNLILPIERTQRIKAENNCDRTVEIINSSQERQLEWSQKNVLYRKRRENCTSGLEILLNDAGVPRKMSRIALSSNHFWPSEITGGDEYLLTVYSCATYNTSIITALIRESRKRTQNKIIKTIIDFCPPLSFLRLRLVARRWNQRSCSFGSAFVFNASHYGYEKRCKCSTVFP